MQKSLKLWEIFEVLRWLLKILKLELKVLINKHRIFFSSLNLYLSVLKFKINIIKINKLKNCNICERWVAPKTIPNKKNDSPAPAN